MNADDQLVLHCHLYLKAQDLPTFPLVDDLETLQHVPKFERGVQQDELLEMCDRILGQQDFKEIHSLS